MTRFTLTPAQANRLIAYAIDHMTNGHNGNGHKRPYTKREADALTADDEATANRIAGAWTKKRKNTGAHTAAALKARRQRTAEILAKFDTKEPRPATIAGTQIGPYIRTGYLRKKAEGYIRTAKQYEA